MESPLNLAHQQSRKADMMVKCKNYEEAIVCHRRAAEFLLQALELSSSKYALESIKLQHQHHLKQQDILQQRIKHLQKLQGKLENMQHQSTQTDEDLVFSPNHYLSSEDQTTNIPTSLFQDERIFHAMSETDSILGYLVHKNKHSNDAEVTCDGNMTVTYQKPKVEKGNITKIPRDNNDVLEELLIQNEELRKQVLDLSRRVEDAQKDKQYLTDKVLRYETHSTRGRTVFEDNDHTGLAMPEMELPPLEMPQFDFDSLNISTCHNSTQKSVIFSGD